jgi:PD-(D/E)XK nuclease superfamily
MNKVSFLQSLSFQLVSDEMINLSETTIVLPNKRAKIFLIEELKKNLPKSTFAPEIISVEEFVQDIAQIRSIDNIELLFEFYEIYLKITSTNIQTFEEFSNWGKTLLQDFNEIDRYIINPEYVFSYLKEIAILERWKLEAKNKTELLDKYLEFWNNIPEYYYSFCKHLKSKKIGYQGLIYREAKSNIDDFTKKLKNQNFVFAGFNALNKAEEDIIQHLISNNKASIIWDIDTVFLNDVAHDAGLFIRRFKSNWRHYKINPFNTIANDFSEEKNISIIGTSKSIGQAKIVSGIIDKIIQENQISLDRIAIILGDEQLLIPILQNLPENVGSLNITMGYTSKNNPIQVLISKLFKAHGNAHKRNSKSYVFYYKEILDLLTNPIIEPYIEANELIEIIKKNNFTFITHEKVFSIVENKNSLFNLVLKKWGDSPSEILETISSILLVIKLNLEIENNPENKLMKTFLFSIYKVINKLISYCSANPHIDNLKTLKEIYDQTIDLAEVSFEGEPLSGLQIMGVLESRVLDFHTVIITSMNEGKFPAGKTNNSFIPYDVKKEIEMPTYKEKDAIYTYHFYHLMQRAKNIHLIYNTESDGLDGGEKSRFITQLEVEKQPKHTITHEIIQPIVPNVAYEKISIEKSEMVQNRLKEIAMGKGFSPSALTSYIRNPIQFYMQRILSIKEADEVEENIAVNTLGTIIHKSLEEIYKPYINQLLTVYDMDKMLKNTDSEVLKQFKEIYKEGEIKTGKNLLAFEVAKRNVENFLKTEKQAILNNDEIKILYLEAQLEREMIDSRLPYPIKIAGNVDRIELRNNKIRIIDYKTGKVENKNVQLKDWNGLTLDIKNDKIIQLLCYSFMFEKQANGIEIEAGIISFKNMKAGFLPFGKKIEKDIQTTITPEILESFKTELIFLINEILNSQIPFEEK